MCLSTQWPTGPAFATGPRHSLLSMHSPRKEEIRAEVTRRAAVAHTRGGTRQLKRSISKKQLYLPMSYVSYKVLIRLTAFCKSDKCLIRHIKHI